MDIYSHEGHTGYFKHLNQSRYEGVGGVQGFVVRNQRFHLHKTPITSPTSDMRRCTDAFFANLCCTNSLQHSKNIPVIWKARQLTPQPAQSEEDARKLEHERPQTPNHGKEQNQHKIHINPCSDSNVLQSIE